MPTFALPFRRAVRTAPLLAPLVALAAACGGDGPGTPTENSPTTARVDVAAQFVLAPSTSGLTLRASAAYELAAGGTAPLAAVTVPVPSTSAQTVPVTLELAPCFNNPARAGAGQGTGANAVCRVVVEYTLLSGTRVVDAQTFGTYTVRGGTQTPQAITFTEITGVRVTRTDGTVVPDGGAARVEVGQTLPLTATAVRADGAPTALRPVRWTSEAPAVATVNEQTGVVTPVAAGQARVVATSAGAQSAVLVNVVPPPAPITVSVAGGVGTGTVTSTPAGINCQVASGRGTGTCTASFPADAPVTLTAVPAAGSAFDVWGGDCAAAAGALTCQLTPTAARTATVRFTVFRTFGVTVVGPGGGRVTSAPAGIDCGVGATSGCSTTFLDGTLVTLTATPDADSRFTGWSGACAGSALTCTVTADQARGVGASFGRRQVTVTLQVAGPGTGSVVLSGPSVSNGTCTTTGQAVSCAATVDAGTTVTAVATPTGGSVYGSWAGACTGSAGTPCTFAATANTTLSTAFGAAPPPTPTDIGIRALRQGGLTNSELSLDLVYERRLNGQQANSGLFTIVVQTGTTSNPVQPVQLSADIGTQVKLTVRGRNGARIVGGSCAGSPVVLNTPVESPPTYSCTFASAPNAEVTFTLAP